MPRPAVRLCDALRLQMNGQTWKQSAAFGVPPPECLKGMLARANHLGNTADETLTGASGGLVDRAVPQVRSVRALR